MWTRCLNMEFCEAYGMYEASWSFMTCTQQKHQGKNKVEPQNLFWPSDWFSLVPLENMHIWSRSHQNQHLMFHRSKQDYSSPQKIEVTMSKNVISLTRKRYYLHASSKVNMILTIEAQMKNMNLISFLKKITFWAYIPRHPTSDQWAQNKLHILGDQA